MDHLNVLDTLMRWYEYEITIGPGERIVNEVTAPLYPEIHDYADPVCDYTYLLSPAQTWKEFHDLEIMINTPYFIRESNLEGFEKCEDGYRLTLESLPAVDLKFTLAEKAGGRIMEPDTGAAGTSVPFPGDGSGLSYSGGRMHRYRSGSGNHGGCDHTDKKNRQKKK